MQVTKAICNKGFSGNSSILPRSNFGVGGQESSPQSLTAHSLDRYAQAQINNGVPRKSNQRVWSEYGKANRVRKNKN